MSIPARWAARMIVSAGSKGISRPSILMVAMSCSCAVAGPRASMVALSADHVERAEGGDDVGDHQPGDELAQALHRGEAGRADAHSVGRAPALADQVQAELAVAPLGV